jgi:hypothetical protein
MYANALVFMVPEREDRPYVITVSTTMHGAFIARQEDEESSMNERYINRRTSRDLDLFTILELVPHESKFENAGVSYDKNCNWAILLLAVGCYVEITIG